MKKTKILRKYKNFSSGLTKPVIRVFFGIF